LWSPSAPAKQKRRSYRAAPRLSSKHGGVTRSERIRGKTNRVRIGHSVTRTQIREQGESNLSHPRGGGRKHPYQIVGLLRLPHASNEDWRTIRRTNREGIGHWRIASCALQRQAAIAATARAHQVLVNGSLQAPPIIERAPLHASNGDGRTIHWTNREGIGAAQIAARCPSKARRKSSMSYAPITSRLTRCHLPADHRAEALRVA
jgi:hypothetical protein